MSEIRVDYDGAQKEDVEQYFEAFLAFFFPEAPSKQGCVTSMTQPPSFILNASLIAQLSVGEGQVSLNKLTALKGKGLEANSPEAFQ